MDASVPDWHVQAARPGVLPLVLGNNLLNLVPPLRKIGRSSPESSIPTGKDQSENRTKVVRKSTPYTSLHEPRGTWHPLCLW